MEGKGRHPILGVWSPDPVLAIAASIGLAATAGTALIIDLGDDAPGSERTLADLVSDGPSLGELSPGRSGIAFLRRGRVDQPAAVGVIERLTRHWPALVLRTVDRELPFATVPVVPLLPGLFSLYPLPAFGVWQPVGVGSDPPGPGPVLPRLRSSVVERMLSGRLPRRSRWVEAWRPVWEMPWA